MTQNRRARVTVSGKDALPALFYFVLMLSLGAFIRDIGSQPGLLTQIADFTQALKEFGRVTDPGSFLLAARDIASTGWVTPENMWVLHLWPPGFVFLEGWILRLGGSTVPFILVLLIFACIGYTAMLEVTRRLLLQYTNGFLAFTLPLIPFIFPFTRVFLLQPAGVVLGEGFAMAFFMTAVVLLLSCGRNHTVAKSLWAGVLLAASAYFRSQYELLISFLTLAAIPCGIWYWIHTRKLPNGSLPNRIARQSIGAMAISLITAHMLMSPWRIHNYMDSGGAAWVQTQQLVIRNALAKQDDLVKANAMFVIQGGGNLACQLEPQYCGETASSYFYKAFFKNIIPWYQAKAQIIGSYWFSSPENLGRPVYPNTLADRIYNGVLLLILALTVPLLAVVRRWEGAPVMYWIQSAFYGCFLCILTFVQFEVRYFYLIKFFSVVTFLILLTVACKMPRSAAQRRSIDAAPTLDETK